MNKTLITLGFFAVIALGIVGQGALFIMRPEYAGTFGTSVIALLGIGSAGVASIYGLGKHQTTLETIKTNTNGTLSGLREEVTRLTNIIIGAGLGSSTTVKVGAHAAPVDTLQAGPAAAAGDLVAGL